MTEPIILTARAIELADIMKDIFAACQASNLIPEHGLVIEQACDMYISQQISKERKGFTSFPASPSSAASQPAAAGPSPFKKAYPASDKQKSYMRQLGIKYDEAISMADAKVLIAEKVGK